MNTEILNSLDLRVFNEISLMINKKTKEPIMYIKLGESYQWPDDSLSVEDVYFTNIQIPPQSDEDADENIVQNYPERRDCIKKCGGIQWQQEVCCSARSAGFKSQWKCDNKKCLHTSYSRTL